MYQIRRTKERLGFARDGTAGRLAMLVGTRRICYGGGTTGDFAAAFTLSKASAVVVVSDRTGAQPGSSVGDFEASEAGNPKGPLTNPSPDALQSPVAGDLPAPSATPDLRQRPRLPLSWGVRDLAEGSTSQAVAATSALLSGALSSE